MSTNTESLSQNMSQEVKNLEKAQTFFDIVYSQFIENKAAVFGAITILLFVLIALFGPLLEYATGIDADTQNVFSRYKPPFTKITASQDVRESAIQNFIKNNEADALIIQNALIEQKTVSPIRPEDALYDWVNIKDRDLAVSAIKKIDNQKTHELAKMINSFDTYHVLGTDELGRDVLMRLIYGTRVSIGVGILVAIVSALIGLIIGSIAGYYGGVIDSILMRVTDALLSLPILPVLVVVAAIDLKKVLGGLVSLAQTIAGATGEKLAQSFVDGIFSGGKESIYKLVLSCVFFRG